MQCHDIWSNMEREIFPNSIWIFLCWNNKNDMIPQPMRHNRNVDVRFLYHDKTASMVATPKSFGRQNDDKVKNVLSCSSHIYLFILKNMTQPCILLCVIEPNNYALTCHKRANLFSENQQNLNKFNTVSYIISQPINVHTDHNLKMLSLIITGFDWPLNGTLLHTLLYCILLWGQGWGDHCKVLIGAVKLFIPAKWTT